jgi:carbon storage regulator
MLVLARNVGQEIVIDGDIVLTVVAIRGGTVRLGVTAPQSVSVDRREVHQRRAEFAADEADCQPRPDSPRIRRALQPGN